MAIVEVIVHHFVVRQLHQIIEVHTVCVTKEAVANR